VPSTQSVVVKSHVWVPPLHGCSVGKWVGKNVGVAVGLRVGWQLYVLDGSIT
jgi:hypothetical protein